VSERDPDAVKDAHHEAMEKIFAGCLSRNYVRAKYEYHEPNERFDNRWD
jgi:hypothetical protein